MHLIIRMKPLAAECGLAILKQGGNAADAAVAIAAALNVTQPTSTGDSLLRFKFKNCFSIYDFSIIIVRSGWRCICTIFRCRQEGSAWLKWKVV